MQRRAPSTSSTRIPPTANANATANATTVMAVNAVPTTGAVSTTDANPRTTATADARSSTAITPSAERPGGDDPQTAGRRAVTPASRASRASLASSASPASVTTAAIWASLTALAVAGGAAATEHVLFPGESIQAVIDDPATEEGDVIVLMPGTWTETIDLEGRALTIRSLDPADPNVVRGTVLDGAGMSSVITMWSGEGPDTVLDGLTVTGGFGSSGGGLFIDDASPTVRRCVFVGNEAFFDGGGIYVYGGAPVFLHCDIVGNVAQYGGGVALLNASAMLVGCRVLGNSATASGGAIDLLFAAGSSMINGTVTANHAGQGGALGSTSSQLAVANTIFWGNTAVQEGTSEVWRTPDVAPTFAYSLVAGSGGSAAWDDALGTDLGGNLDADPTWIDPLGADGVAGTLDDDLALLAGSPAIDAGNDELLPPDSADLDGDGDTAEPLSLDALGAPRIMDDPAVGDDGAGNEGKVDLGVAEHTPPVAPSCPGDLSGDGLVGITDLIMLISAWGSCPGCAQDLDGDGVVAWRDLLIVIGAWGSCPEGSPAEANGGQGSDSATGGRAGRRGDDRSRSRGGKKKKRGWR